MMLTHITNPINHVGFVVGDEERAVRELEDVYRVQMVGLKVRVNEGLHVQGLHLVFDMVGRGANLW